MSPSLHTMTFLLTLGLGGLAGAEAARTPQRPTPILIELFTSEGCSSCPPADAFLDELSRAQDIPGVQAIVLGFHVDYWDYLGWADPFSSAANSARQAEYSGALVGRQGVFTPQAILDGRHSVVASGEAALRQAALQRLKEQHGRVSLSATGEGRVQVKATVSQVPQVSPGDTAEVWVALTESGLSTRVARGENAGHTLRHAPVVRRLAKLGAWAGQETTLSHALEVDPAWRRENLTAVAFVQERKSRRVLGTASAAVVAP
jgi:hypothetical protein